MATSDEKLMAERPSAARHITQADVARFAGVSTAVVSYVVNGGPRPVAVETAERVRQAIDVLGYRPNEQARALTLGRSGTIGFVMSEGLNPLRAEFISELTVAANQVGMRIVTANVGQDDELARDIDNLMAQRVDGLLFASSAARADIILNSRLGDTPVVFIDMPGPILAQRTIGVDAQGAAEQLVTHLIEVHGHRGVALIIGDHGFGNPDPRERGWWQALKSAGLGESPLVRVPFSMSGGYYGGLQILAGRPRPTAIFASSDQQAFGLLRAINEQGLRVPEDVAVVTYDGTRLTEFTPPPLTVARQPITAIAEAAISLLGKSVGPAGRHIALQAELVIRSSCGCGPTPPPAR